jgi:hypothetical protein
LNGKELFLELGTTSDMKIVSSTQEAAVQDSSSPLALSSLPSLLNKGRKTYPL